MHAVLDENKVNTNISEGNEDIKEEINNITKLFNIKLFQDDLENIVKILNILDDEKFINQRYNIDNYFNNNSYVNKLKEIYPILKKT